MQGARELTPRQLEILQGLAEGLNARQIGERLFISVHTVKSLRDKVYIALGADNGPHAVAIGYRRGILS